VLREPIDSVVITSGVPIAVRHFGGSRRGCHVGIDTGSVPSDLIERFRALCFTD
jgi:hypothetical protein